MDRLISCKVAAEMMRAKADMVAPEYKMPFEAATRKKTEPITRRTDDLGRVAIPKGFRERLGIQEGDMLEIEVDGPSGAIVMRKRAGDRNVRNGSEG
mgnify:CR=1 FL=1